jgi:hypothetical protein
LFWVRRVLDGAIDVIPAVIDVELADPQTVLLPHTATPLGMELALMTGVRGRVDPRAFLQYVADLDVAGQVAEALAAAREGREPQGITVGPPIEAEDDQRIEYRQVLADLLVDLSPSMWNEGDAAADPRESNVQDLIDVISHELPERHFGASVGTLEQQYFAVDAEHELCFCARVIYLDTSVIVAVLRGPKARLLLDKTPLAEACLPVVFCQPDADAVAVTAIGEEWPAVVLPVPYMRRAYEPPGGAQKGPRMVMEPLPIVDALAKHLDRQETAWEVTDTVGTPIRGADIAALAARNAVSAVAQLSGEGKRAITKAKNAAWTNLPVDLSERITEAIVAISGNEPLHSVLNRLTQRDST